MSPKSPFDANPALLQDAARRSLQYLGAIGERAVAPSPAAVLALAQFDEPLPQQPSDPAETLALLDELVSPATMGMVGPRFFGFVIGGALPVTVASNWLATAWDQNTALQQATPGVSRLEIVALRWLLELLDLPRESAGAFVTGATMANMTALAAARHRLLANVGWNVESRGLFGAPPLTVMVGEEAHPTLFKSLALLGLGSERVRRIPVDAQGRMRVDALPAIDGPTIICTQAGNINSGAFDPIDAICRHVAGSGAWVHVDGAFGLWARVSPRLAQLAQGIERADSWATDAHKWLNVPYDSGLAFVRDKDALQAAMAINAAYLPANREGRDPSDFTPELSRRARGVDVWAALRSLGRAGVRTMIERSCDQASLFAGRLRAAGHEVLNDVVLNQVVVAFGDADKTRRVTRAVQDDGTCWCGATVWKGRTAMRISICNWSTTDADIERSVAAILRVAARQLSWKS